MTYRCIGMFPAGQKVAGDYDTDKKEFIIYRASGNYDVYNATPVGVSRCEVGRYKRTDWYS